MVVMKTVILWTDPGVQARELIEFIAALLSPPVKKEKGTLPSM